MTASAEYGAGGNARLHRRPGLDSLLVERRLRDRVCDRQFLCRDEVVSARAVIVNVSVRFMFRLLKSISGRATRSSPIESPLPGHPAPLANRPRQVSPSRLAESRFRKLATMSAGSRYGRSRRSRNLAGPPHPARPQNRPVAPLREAPVDASVEVLTRKCRRTPPDVCRRLDGRRRLMASVSEFRPPPQPSAACHSPTCCSHSTRAAPSCSHERCSHRAQPRIPGHPLARRRGEVSCRSAKASSNLRLSALTAPRRCRAQRAQAVTASRSRSADTLHNVPGDSRSRRVCPVRRVRPGPARRSRLATSGTSCEVPHALQCLIRRPAGRSGAR